MDTCICKGHWDPPWNTRILQGCLDSPETEGPTGTVESTRDIWFLQDTRVLKGHLDPPETLCSSRATRFQSPPQTPGSTRDIWIFQDIEIHLGYWFLQGKLGLPRTQGSSRKSGFHQKHLDSEGNLNALRTFKFPLGLWELWEGTVCA